MTTPASRTLTVGPARLTATLALLLALAGVTAVAQTTNTDGSTPAGLAPGAPAGSYALSGFESVNVFNGGLNFSLPLLKVGGRGGAGHALPLTIEQKWRVELFAEMAPGEQPKYTPLGEWWGELKPGYGPGVMEGRRAGSGEWHQGSYCGSAGSGFFAEMITRLTFTAADGTEFELRDQLTGGQPAYLGNVPCSLAGNSRGTVFVASDGSSTTFISDAPIYDYKYNPMGLNDQFRPSGYLLMRDGTRYRVDGGLVSWVRDRNGNRVSFGYDIYGRVSVITDPLDRQVTITYAGTNGTSYDLITFQGFGGQSRAIKVWQAPLQTSPTVHLLRTTQPGDSATTETYADLFPQMGAASSNSHFNPTKPSKVELPDGRFYQFRYNEYGELARVELPTGGSIEYDWVDASRGVDSFVYRRVSARRVYREGSTLENTTTYGEDGYVKVFHSGGALAAQTRHYFHGDAFWSLAPDPTRTPVTPAPWRQGREYRTEFFDIVNDSPVLRRKVEHTWQQPAAGASWPLAQAESDEKARANNPQITETRVTLSDTNQVSTQAFAYDRYSNRTDVWEHDYGVGAAGAPVRHTYTEYLTTHPTSTADYASPNPNAGSIHLRGLPARTSVYAAGVEQARTTFEYDNYAADLNHAALVDRPGITGFDSSFSASRHARGNATATTRYLLTNGTVTGSVSAYAQYDIAGNAVKTIDGRGIASAVSYNDSFSDLDNSRDTYAYPTGTTSAVPAPPSPHPAAGRGSATPLTSSAVYDYWTGLVSSMTDANGRVTTLSYADESGVADPLDRLKKVTRPDGGRTRYEYHDDPSAGIYVKTFADFDAARSVETRQYFDGLGRPVRSFLYDGVGATPWSAADTHYDDLGRAWKVSNPYKVSAPGAALPDPLQCAACTTTDYDALGRVRAVTTPDGAAVRTDYDGSRVLVTDQAGKQRVSRSDALGQLREVWEVRSPDTASGTEAVSFPSRPGVPAVAAGYRTAYDYDALGNLRKVTQGGQLRHFMYDSLGRLIRSKNPEQGDFAPDADFPALADSTVSSPGNSAWSVAYSYDENGNLLKRKDARNVTTTYGYDNLNRNVTVSYANDPQNTPPVDRYYDEGTDGRGRLSRHTTSGAWGSETAYSYDVAGRVKEQSQRFRLAGGTLSGPYTVSRLYDKAGNVTSQSYPSGRVVEYPEYDAAGRLRRMKGNLGDTVERTYADAISYDEAGRMREERFGTQTPLHHKLNYNVRGQLFDVRLSTAGSAQDEWNWDRGRLAFYYGAPLAPHGQSNSSNNGNVARTEHWVPTDPASPYGSGGQGPWVIYAADYQYDALNRLSSASEVRMASGAQAAASYTQAYTYDRWGNRGIDAGNTQCNAAAFPGCSINEKQFSIDTATNRLAAPTVQSGVMEYDAAGNLTNDTYTGAGGRAYDAENRMTSGWGTSTLIGAFNNQYGYDADGRRVRRKTESGEVWQVYGVGGELVAEYGANGAPSAPRKEYGYRAGGLLVVADSGSGGGGYSSDASSSFSPSQNPSAEWAYGYRPSGGQFTQLNAASTIFGAGTATWAPSAQSCCASVTKNTTGSTLSYPAAPNVVQPADTLNLHPGPAGERAVVRWTAPQAGSHTISGRFQGIDTFGTTTDVKIEHNGALIFTGQVSGYGTQVPFNLTLVVAAGDKVEFSVGYGANGNYNCDSTGLAVTVARGGGVPAWQGLVGVSAAGEGLTKTGGAAGWNAGASSAEAIQSGDGYVEFTAAETNTYRMVGLSNGDSHPSFEDIDFAIYPAAGGALYVYEGGIERGQVGWYGAGDRLKVEVGGGAVKYYRNGALVYASGVTPAYPLRVDTSFYSVGATAQGVMFSAGGQGSTSLRWIVSDHLGTPRITADQTGSLEGIKRHDYLPFGEEVGAGVGGRTTGQGYVGDNVRQKFTGYERDNETGLDYAQARYYASTQGRFTSPDPFNHWTLEKKKQDEFISNPQRWNKYVYVLNNPLRYVDPNGLAEIPAWKDLDKKLREDLSRKLGEDAEKNWNSWSNDQRQHLLNERAVLIEAGVWDRVCSISYGTLKYEYGQAFYTPDNKGTALAFTVDAPSGTRMQTDVLTENGFPLQINLNHPENSGDYYGQRFASDGIILHLGILKKPSADYITGHFDAGGGSILSRAHMSDWWNNTGPSPDRVTTALGKTGAAQHLRGVSESMDKLLAQPKR